jgi:hypothetical protein
VIGLELDVNKPVGECWCQFPATRGQLRRIGRGNNTHSVGQFDVADPALEYDRNKAACTAGGAVFISSRNKMPPSLSSSTHEGGRNCILSFAGTG